MSHAQVLVIEDDPLMVNAYRRVLSCFDDMTIDGVTTNNEAIHMVQKNKYDIVITNLTQHGEYTRVPLIQAIRQSPMGKQPMIFVISGILDICWIDVVSSGVDWICPKPVDPQLFVGAVKRVYDFIRNQ